MRTGKRIKRRIANIRLVELIHPKSGKPAVNWASSLFILECGHVTSAAPGCCQWRGAHTVRALVFIDLTIEKEKTWQEVGMNKVCRDCRDGEPPDFGLLSIADAEKIGMPREEWLKGPGSTWRMTA